MSAQSRRSANAALLARLATKIFVETLRLTRRVDTATSAAWSMTRKIPANHRHDNPFNHRKVNGQLYWYTHIPGYPSPAFDRVFRKWLAQELGLIPHTGLYSAHVAMTNRCGMKCAHCCAWDALGATELREEEEIIDSIARVIGLGAARVTLTGGEPTARLALVHRILREFPDQGVQFWITTSGAGLTAKRIRTLKDLGLTGISLSLDHHDPVAHDRFRGQEGSHRQVLSCAQHATAIGLVTELSLCATNEFITDENLEAYARLAEELNVTFVQILEPKPLGKYADRDMTLTPPRQNALEAFYERALESAVAGERPLYSYLDYRNRRHPCVGGKKHLYVDARGAAHPCPFCQTVSVAVADLTPANLGETLFCPHVTACRA